MIKRFLRLLSALAIASVLLTACSGTVNTTQQNQPLRVSWSLWPGYYPMVIADKKGLFEKHGVQVEPAFYNIYANQASDLSSGMIDGALMTLSDTLFDSISKDIKIVLVLDNSAGADQVVASSEIKSISDLSGKRIGVQSSTVSGVLLIREMLQANGISASDVTFVQVSPENVPASIPGTIDAGYTYEPYTSSAIANGSSVIFSSADAPGVIVDVLAFRKTVIEQRPEDVKAFIAAWFEAQQYWKDNPADGNAIIAEAIGLKPEEISSEGVTLFDLNANLKTFTQGTDNSSIYYTAEQELQFIINSGDITNPVDIKDLLDPSFLK
jgi:NitT/TauT family transport system substrate-binding protein